ncbi:PTS sugar transporter subunit IIA [Gordonia caeni]|uniref:Ascorbate-specific PTS system EIIA component n=1 Tax=Gordonia caeni TaxID=1007097 RepID=A0ABP7NTW9_9ACTN
MTALTELLSPDAIALDVEADDWQAAIGAAGALLTSTGVATAEYTTEMVDAVLEKGPYIVIAPGFAFAHARPSPAVLRTGLSWVRLARPVAFGHTANDPVDLVVALAATDAKAHTTAMAELAKVIGDADRRAALEGAQNSAEVMEILEGVGAAAAPVAAASAAATPADTASAGSRRTNNKILTVCGNGVGTSLFLKNTLEKVLAEWGWSPYIEVEATDTISAKGKAKEADLILTSGEIAKALGDLGVPTTVIENFTSTAEIDAALRANYDV